MCDQIICLIKKVPVTDENGRPVLDATGRQKIDKTSREVFCGFRSIGMKEFYSANSTDFRPELKLVLADYLDYDEETLVDFQGKRYRVLRTYRVGQELELTLEKAPAEDGEPDG